MHIQAAQVEVDAGRMSESLLKRLDLDKGDKWDSVLHGVTDVADLPDPTGIVSYAKELDDGLELYVAKVTTAVGGSARVGRVEAGGVGRVARGGPR